MRPARTMGRMGVLLCCWCVLLALADDAGLGGGGVQRTASAIKIGKTDRGTPPETGSNVRGNSLIKIGNAKKFLNKTRPLPTLTTSMTSTSIPLSYASPQPETVTNAEFSNGTKLLRVSSGIFLFYDGRGYYFGGYFFGGVF